MRYGEDADWRRDMAWDRERLQPRVAPRSAEEDRALSRISELREMEREGLSTTHPDKIGFGPFYTRSSGMTAAARRKRRRHWRGTL